MVEFDKTLRGFSRLVNQCYEQTFPNLPCYPKFSASRAMTSLWKNVVYHKLEQLILERFTQEFNELLDHKFGVLLEKKRPEVVEGMEFADAAEEFPVLYRTVQAVVDLSINELRVHFLGSTKFVPDAPYSILNEHILSLTR
eukprot:TRINITY_DN14543_c0_g1_i8.p1 TRINITY_DN14543_c0_g1~~TRINITY_DN14543_c0_g1_i8.p1  ORF type:complete len:141 (-),score=33.76 TRINITY_DN14543_c0_g1_i8:42-464(-)